MQIVIEYVILQNFVLQAIILLTMADIMRQKSNLIWLSALLYSCLAVVLPIFKLNYIWQFVIQIIFGIVIVNISFKFKKFMQFFRYYLLYILTACIYNGISYFLTNLIGQSSTIVVLLVFIATFLAVKFILKFLNYKKGIDKFCYRVVIENNGKFFKCQGFLDSGNLLFDPMTNQPICLINFKLFNQIFKDITVEELLLKKVDKKLRNAHYVNIETLSNSGQILIFQVDKICVAEKEVKNAVLGLSLKNFKQTFDSDIILHNYYSGGIQNESI